MKEPKWLQRAFVLMAHNRMLMEHGGSPGVRDEGLLDSALGRPRQKFDYDSECTLFDIAAAYGYGIAKNHPFIDGNKRTAFVAAAVFLQINGIRLEATEADAVIATREMAAGNLGERQFSDWLAQNCTG